MDIEFAHDVSGLTGAAALAPNTLPKTLFLDIVNGLKIAPASLDPTQIPAKLEGIAFGEDITYTDPATKQAVTRHTLFVSNDNDFLATFEGQDNPNQFFVFAFDDADLPDFVPQRFHQDREDDDHDGHDHDGR